ncbi:hypothetical protein N7532_008677 [Penicillium argentinense]|uniref:Uncharacterized protein n=1 Tax=Penicillium argentinense TaxID=1131581 RepID=A0A9W9EXT3_9EURO|nr:uncharacterized protein N7532_008677 [Penicillium argentinense]KAJ5089993.1 hypothetical protein N7532_008677 [Penicillium argentinense]
MYEGEWFSVLLKIDTGSLEQPHLCLHTTGSSIQTPHLNTIGPIENSTSGKIGETQKTGNIPRDPQLDL